MIQEISTGAIPSVKDYRSDIAAAAVVPQFSGVALPATYQTELAPVMMQALIPACVSHDITDALKLYWFRKTGKWIDFSPRFLDILSAEADIPLDGGRRPQTVLKVAINIGCCTTASLPNDTSLTIAQYRDPSVITAAMRAEAAQYKIPGYIIVPNDIQSTRAAIFLYGMVTTLFQIGAELYTAPSGQSSWTDADIDPLRTPKAIIGGHQMGPKGWVSPTLNTLRNQWSAEWANKGEANYDPAAWAPFIVEQWAIAEIPPDTTDFLKMLPSPSNFHYQWSKDLQMGDNNEDVKFAQVAFMILGYLAPITAADLGTFGPKTAAANAKYQMAHNIPVSQMHVGPMTRAALNAQFSV